MDKFVKSLQGIQYGNKCRLKKTKVMVFSKRQGIKCVIEVNGKKLEQVSAYKYLVSWLTEDGKSEKEVRDRIALVKRAF